MANPTDDRRAPAAGEPERTRGEPELQLAEVMVLTTVRDDILAHDGDAVSGHSLRQELRRRGLAKLDAVVAIHSLVDHGLVARVRRDDPDGRFYTAYQLTTRGEAWLRAHDDQGPDASGDQARRSTMTATAQ